MDAGLIDSIKQAALAMSGWEFLAVLLGIAYLLLAVRENILCWYAAFFQTLILTFLFWDASLLMESGLQIYYLLMAIYGWYQWRYHPGAKSTSLPISTWPPARHGLVIGGVLLITLASGYLLANNTNAALPYLDSFTTWGSVITTYMVARKVLENWIYWLVIDSVSIYLYLDRGFYLMALLFVAYIVIIFIGFWQWRQHYQREQALCAA